MRFADEQEALLAYEVGQIDTREGVDNLPNHAVRKLELHTPIEMPCRPGTRQLGERSRPATCAPRSAG